jgi:hypothetical protein
MGALVAQTTRRMLSNQSMQQLAIPASDATDHVIKLFYLSFDANVVVLTGFHALPWPTFILPPKDRDVILSGPRYAYTVELVIHPAAIYLRVPLHLHVVPHRLAGYLAAPSAVRVSHDGFRRDIPAGKIVSTESAKPASQCMPADPSMARMTMVVNINSFASD